MRLSELFAPGKDSLAIYSFMFPRDPGDERPGPETGETAQLPLAEGPCPSCVALLDQLDGAVEHASQHINLAVVAKAPLPRVLTFARGARLAAAAAAVVGRQHLQPRLPGRDRGGAPAADAERVPPRRRDDPPLLGLGALLRADDPGQDPRHVGTLEPVWNLFDLTPEGRPTDWDEQLSYD